MGSGMLATLPDAMLLLAPHANSYRRLSPGGHAPTNVTWGIDNRSAAIRVSKPARPPASNTASPAPTATHTSPSPASSPAPCTASCAN